MPASLPALQSLMLDTIDARSYDSLRVIAARAPKLLALAFRNACFTDYAGIDDVLDIPGAMGSMRKVELDDVLLSALSN